MTEKEKMLSGKLYDISDAELVKQYKKLFGMDEVDLSFDDDALHAIAKKTLEKETGARGLRSITENILLPIMYDIPSDEKVQSVQITKECVENGDEPIIMFKEIEE